MLSQKGKVVSRRRKVWLAHSLGESKGIEEAPTCRREYKGGLAFFFLKLSFFETQSYCVAQVGSEPPVSLPQSEWGRLQLFTTTLGLDLPFFILFNS